jgi:hypothetical protein
VQNCCTMVNVAIANRDAMEINKQVNAEWHRPVLRIIRPNTTYRSSSIVFYYTLQHVSVLEISHYQVDVGYIERYIYIYVCVCVCVIWYDIFVNCNWVVTRWQ